MFQRNVWLFTCFGFVALLINGCGQSGFSAQDVEKIKESIRQEFSQKENIKVVEIQMIQESPQKLTGFVKLKKFGFLGLSEDITKKCEATMGENHQSIWECL
jgi:hypothetical protein